MRRLRCLRAAAVVVALAAFVAPPASAQSPADVIIEWNRILNTAIATPGANPPTVFVTRPAAMVQIAVFDALNSIDPQYAPYVTAVNAPQGASSQAAAAQAAHDVLVALMPSQTAVFDAALAASLRGIDPAAAAAGSSVGAATARGILEARANDGWNRPNGTYILPNLPGYWQSTPTANAPAGFVHYPNVQGFILPSARRLMVEAPPPLTSARYAADFNEVKNIGGATSTARTEAETALANTWASVGNTTNPISAWNAGMQDLTRSRNLSALDAARMFAIVNMSMHDALWVAFSGKFEYGLWRPVTAIREAGRDGNPATEADPTWLPLVQTPPYPAYPGNNACIGAAASAALARLLGRDDIPFTITWTVPNGTNIVRSYNGFRQAADEEARSRIFAGIHYTFDNTASFGVCTPLGDYAAANYLRSR